MQGGEATVDSDMDTWLQVMLAVTVAVVTLGLLSLVWSAAERLWRNRTATHEEDEGAPLVIRGGLDYRDHPGPVVERRGPDVAERRYRDAIDRTSGENPRT